MLRRPSPRGELAQPRGELAQPRGELAQARSELAQARGALRLTSLPAAGHVLEVAVDLTASPAQGRLILVLVQNEGHQEVRRGENGGRTLRHVSIARQFRTLAEIASKQAYTGKASFALPEGAAAGDFHVVAFLQRGAGGPILASATT